MSAPRRVTVCVINNTPLRYRLIEIMALVFIVALLGSCKKNDEKCIQVKYVMGYCPKTGASLVTLTNPNSDATHSGNSYEMALLNVPKVYQVRDKVFYVSYHYDEDKSKLDLVACPAIFGNVNVFVCDAANETSCNN
ncbi:MAG: hypothetical protein H7325_02560 [Pedobacter sp.]|nr:hypothetical protein [Pedobacter sp.]